MSALTFDCLFFSHESIDKNVSPLMLLVATDRSLSAASIIIIMQLYINHTLVCIIYQMFITKPIIMQKAFWAFADSSVGRGIVSKFAIRKLNETMLNKESKIAKILVNRFFRKCMFCQFKTKRFTCNHWPVRIVHLLNELIINVGPVNTYNL